MFTAAQLAHWTSARWTTPPASGTLLTGFSTDTRTLRPGEIFVALRTSQRDGHAYLSAARAAGAPAAIVASPDPALPDFPQLITPDPLAAFQTIAREHRCTFPGPVIGITGSAGKTSTKNLLALLLSSSPDAADILATEGNLNNHIGVPLTLTRLDPARHRFAVVEAGISAPGEMATLAAMIQPDIAIITLIAPAHLDALRDLETIAREKQLLFSTLRPGGLALRGAGVSPATLASPSAPPPPPPPAITHTPTTTTLTLTPATHTFTLPRVTDGMARNAALAIRAALHLGVSATEIQTRLARWTPPPLRGEWRTDTHNRRLYLDCYNANPASMLDALETFAATATPPDAPRLYIIGCMEELGPESARHHADLGRALAALLRADDEVIAIGPHAEHVARASRPPDDAQRRPVKCSTLNVKCLTFSDTPAALASPATAALLASHRGPMFVKGSRRHALERLVEIKN